MPESIVGVVDVGNPDGIHRVRDVQQNSVPGTRARRQTERRENGNVMALIGGRRRLGTFAVVPTLPETIQSAGLRVGENARAAHDLRQFRMRQRHLDNVDAKQRGVGILIGISPGTTRQFFFLTNAARARDIDVNVLLVFRIDHQRVRVRPAATLHRGHLLRIRQVADIENAHPAEAVGAGRRQRTRTSSPSRRPRGTRGRRFGSRSRRRHVSRRQRDSLGAAIGAPVQRLRRHEEQMAVYRHVALAARTKQRRPELDLRRAVDVVEVDAVVIPDKEVIAAESHIGVRGAERNGGTAPASAASPLRLACRVRRRRGRNVRGVGGSVIFRRKTRRLRQGSDVLQTESRLAGVVKSGLKTHSWIVFPRARIHIDRRCRRLCRTEGRQGDQERQRRQSCFFVRSFILLEKHVVHNPDFRASACYRYRWRNRTGHFPALRPPCRKGPEPW